MFCECCGMQLRASPAGRIYKEKVRDIGCFIRKPVTIDQLVKRVKAELE